MVKFSVPFLCFTVRISLWDHLVSLLVSIRLNKMFVTPNGASENNPLMLRKGRGWFSEYFSEMILWPISERVVSFMSWACQGVMLVWRHHSQVAFSLCHHLWQLACEMKLLWLNPTVQLFNTGKYLSSVLPHIVKYSIILNTTLGLQFSIRSQVYL